MRRPGFTLVELIVALTITGMVTSAGYAAFTTVIDRRERANAIAAETSRAAAIRDAVRRWLGAAELTVEDDDVVFRGLDGTHAGVPDDELTFRTGDPRPFEGAPITMRLFIDRNDSTPERGLVAVFRASGQVLPRTVELEPHAVALELRYLSGLYGVRVWQSSWVSTTILPLGIELSIGGITSDSIPRLLSLPIVVPVAKAQ